MAVCPADQTRELLEKRRCLRLPGWFEVHEGRIMEWFADVQCGSTPSGNVAGAPFTVRAAFAGSRLRFAGRGIEDSWYLSEQALEEIAREWSEAVRVS